MPTSALRCQVKQMLERGCVAARQLEYACRAPKLNQSRTWAEFDRYLENRLPPEIRFAIHGFRFRAGLQSILSSN
jgi:hypothetical protein